MSLDSRVSRMLPRGRRATADQILVRLVLDLSPVLRSRRRRYCRRLGHCEDAWIAAHGSAQAKCPAGCRDYRAVVPRARP